MKRLIRRKTCLYCKRELTLPSPPGGTSFTWDHVRPKSQGGWKRAPCCWDCNNLKGDLDVDEWFWFIGAAPRWWKRYANSDQVRDAIRQERVRRAYAGEPQLGRGVR